MRRNMPQQILASVSNLDLQDEATSEEPANILRKI